MPSIWLDQPGLSDRDAVIDCLYRFAQGMDESDEAVLASSLDVNAFIDLAQPGRVMGVPSPELSGRDNILKQLRKGFFPLDITTNFTNVRVALKPGDKEAHLKANVIGVHYRGGDGPLPEKQDSMWIGNRYEARFIKAANEGWRIKDIDVICIWAHGDSRILKG